MLLDVFCWASIFKTFTGTVIQVVTPKTNEALLNGPETNLSEAEHGLLKQYKGLIREQVIITAYTCFVNWYSCHFNVCHIGSTIVWIKAQTSRIASRAC